MTIAASVGSFDPITRGHVDIITRAARLFDRLVVGVYSTPQKNLLFDLDERLALVQDSVGHLPNVEVRPYSGLTVDFCRAVGAGVIIRGLRAVSDFETEFALATLNRQMAPGLETLCLFAGSQYSFLSSSLIKEIAENGGDVASLVPALVAARLQERYAVHPTPVSTGG